MADVEIYTKSFCGFCRRAKALLESKGVAYDELEVSMNRDREAEMIERANGRTTVPQIFIAGRHVGGCDELYDLDRRGELDPLLGADRV